jgi:hypothetical protein
MTRAEKIAMLNDRFRGMAIDVVLTQGIIHGVRDVIELMKTIEQFDAFTPDNDPYGEHDFGSLFWYGNKIFWKIDYYDSDLTYGEDPLSVDCLRVLTIMLANEY